jgi:tRNA A58 N-methylase Trm61
MPVRIDPEESETGILFEFAGGFAGKRVLEIGAGDGRLTWRYAAQAAHVTALEPKADKIAAAQEEMPASLRDRVTFLPDDLETFDPGEGASGFDLVILSWVL